MFPTGQYGQGCLIWWLSVMAVHAQTQLENPSAVITGIEKITETAFIYTFTHIKQVTKFLRNFPCLCNLHLICSPELCEACLIIIPIFNTWKLRLEVWFVCSHNMSLQMSPGLPLWPVEESFLLQLIWAFHLLLHSSQTSTLNYLLPSTMPSSLWEEFNHP